MSYQHLPGVVTYEQDWAIGFAMTIGAATETVTIAYSDVHAYGESSAGVVTAGTFLALLQTSIETAFASTTPAITSSVISWVLDDKVFPKWRIDLTLDATAASVYVEDTGAALTPMGIRVDTSSRQHSAADRTVVDGTWRLESNGYTAGIWAPGMPAQMTPDTGHTMRINRSAFSPANVTKVKLATRTDYDASYEHVDAALRTLWERDQFPTMEVRAGLSLADHDPDRHGTLDQLIEAASDNKGMNLHIARGSLYAVDIDSDELKTSSFASGSTSAGIHYTVDLPFVAVA